MIVLLKFDCLKFPCFFSIDCSTIKNFLAAIHLRAENSDTQTPQWMILHSVSHNNTFVLSPTSSYFIFACDQLPQPSHKWHIAGMRLLSLPSTSRQDHKCFLEGMTHFDIFAFWVLETSGNQTCMDYCPSFFVELHYPKHLL